MKYKDYSKLRFIYHQNKAKQIQVLLMLSNLYGFILLKKCIAIGVTDSYELLFECWELNSGLARAASALTQGAISPAPGKSSSSVDSCDFLHPVS